MHSVRINVCKVPRGEHQAVALIAHALAFRGMTRPRGAGVRVGRLNALDALQFILAHQILDATSNSAADDSSPRPAFLNLILRTQRRNHGPLRH